MKLPLEQSAHIYVAASDKQKVSKSAASGKEKNRARLKLQREALRFAANCLEEWVGCIMDNGARAKVAKGGIEQLRELVASLEQLKPDE